MNTEAVWRRHPDSNRGIRVLQTLALPLGYAAAKHLKGRHLYRMSEGDASRERGSWTLAIAPAMTGLNTVRPKSMRSRHVVRWLPRWDIPSREAAWTGAGQASSRDTLSQPGQLQARVSVRKLATPLGAARFSRAC